MATLATIACIVLALAACTPRPPEAKPAQPAHQPVLEQPAAQQAPATAAVGPQARRGHEANAAEAPKPAVADKRIPKLTIAVPLDTGPLNIYTSDSAYDYLVELVYDKLLAPSPYVDKPLPGLAESATQVDPSTWVVKLRDGVKWHDGKPFTADDVVFTYTSFRDGSPNRYTHHVNDVPKIDQIVAEDARTVKFSCNYPVPLARDRHIRGHADPPEAHLGEHQGAADLQGAADRDRAVQAGRAAPDQLYRFQANEATSWASRSWTSW